MLLKFRYKICFKEFYHKNIKIFRAKRRFGDGQRLLFYKKNYFVTIANGMKTSPFHHCVRVILFLLLWRICVQKSLCSLDCVGDCVGINVIY